MPSTYPTTLDAFATTRADADATATTHPADHNNANDAINKIEAELGTDPSGSFTDVKTRLNSRLTCRKTADQTISSTTALTNLTDLTLPITTTGLDYWFKFYLVCTSSAGGTNGIRIGLTCPAVTGYIHAQVIIPRTIDPTVAAGTAAAALAAPADLIKIGQITSSGDSVVSDIVPVGVNFGVTVEGILSNPSATGSIQIQGANEVTTVNGNIIRRGAWGELYIN
jgi:hypothetical protein